MARRKQEERPLCVNHIIFNEEQKLSLELIDKHRIVILSGAAGTGKSLVAVFAGLKYLSEERFERIIISRPAVTTEDFGFLPGDLDEKFTNVYLMPIIDFINRLGHINHKGFSTLLSEKKILPLPVAFMRGFNMENSFVIIDEAENLTEKQMLMVLTRLGKNSTMVITGDEAQCDLDRRHKSGFDKLLRLAKRSACTEFMKHVELTKVERDQIVDVILNEWKNV